MVWRIDVVAPDIATSTTYFSQIERRTSSLSSALMPPALQAARKSSARFERRPSYSPNTSRLSGPVWAITPGRPIAVPT